MIDAEPEKPLPGAAAPRPGATGDVGLVAPSDFVYAHPFTFVNGLTIPGFTLRYETYGRLNTTRDNAVLICHALSGDHHCAGWHADDDRKPGWWNNLIGPGKAVDTGRFFVICANVLGGCQGSTGPSSLNPATGRPYGLEFPFVTISDMVRSQKLLLEHLGIAELHAVIGGSMGGMTATQFAIEFPGLVRRVLAMATTARESAQAIAFNEVGRQAIMQDPAWNRGAYPREGGPRVGLAIARMMAHITYLSDASMDRKFGRRRTQPGAQPADPAAGAPAAADIQFEVESYLRYQGQSFINRFDANTYLYITRALDQFDLAHGKASLEAALAPVLAETLVVGFASDWLFPPEQNRAIVLALLRAGKRASYAELATDLGHDSFLLESEELYTLVRAFLEREQVVFDFAI
jgi:homoserine O-acetyltransferase